LPASIIGSLGGVEQSRIRVCDLSPEPFSALFFGRMDGNRKGQKAHIAKLDLTFPVRFLVR
jgi:hypothetical protein